ncbi:hypothetical protein CY35_10G085400 [Sphagnum magellanicum]|nr:hypothetical protein CY35_10G085400 [Sphagnum magellanicum]
MTKELGLDMAIRSLKHLLHYGEQNTCWAVPLALGILPISNPKLYSMFAYGIIIHTPFVLQVNIAQGLVHMGKGLLTLNPLSFRPLLAVQVCPNYTLLYFATIDNDTY